MKKVLLLTLLLLPLLGYAGTDSTKVDRPRILTGFSGGMALHAGYGFTSNPQELFRNPDIGSKDYIKSLPKDGIFLGLGGQLRFHLLDHIHVGGEGYMSLMPLMKSGSNIRFGWGGAFVDGYITAGRIRPMIGLGLGGGSMKRLFVPEKAEMVHSNEVQYNASYTKTPFFYLNPYVGLEILLGVAKMRSLYLRLDYMLPFGANNSSLSQDIEGSKNVWSNFITPSGPRLFVGIMFGKQKD